MYVYNFNDTGTNSGKLMPAYAELKRLQTVYPVGSLLVVVTGFMAIIVDSAGSRLDKDLFDSDDLRWIERKTICCVLGFDVVNRMNVQYIRLKFLRQHGQSPDVLETSFHAEQIRLGNNFESRFAKKPT